MFAANRCSRRAALPLALRRSLAARLRATTRRSIRRPSWSTSSRSATCDRTWSAGPGRRLRAACASRCVRSSSTERVYAASHDGEVIALAADNGRRAVGREDQAGAVRRTGSGRRPGRARLERRRHHRARCHQRQRALAQGRSRSEVLARPLIVERPRRDPHGRRSRRRAVGRRRRARAGPSMSRCRG